MKYHSWNVTSPKLGGILGKSPTDSSGSQRGVILPPGGHLKMSGDIFVCNSRERRLLLVPSGYRPGILQTFHNNRALTKEQVT